MKKKIVALGLLVLLGLSLPANARPHDMGRPNGGCHSAHVRVAPHYHHIRRCPAVGVSFSTGVLPRHCYSDPFYYNYPLNYPLYNNYYTLPAFYTPSLYMNFRM